MGLLQDAFKNAEEKKDIKTIKFTGLINAELVGVNPTNEERLELGMREYTDRNGDKVDEEYVTPAKDKDGNIEDFEQVKLLFIFKVITPTVVNDKTVVQKEMAGTIIDIPVWVKNTERAVSSKGSYLYTNGQLQKTWGKAIDRIEPSNYMTLTNKTTGKGFDIRRGLDGEDRFIEFMASLIPKQLPLGVADWNWDAIFGGDFSELKEYIELSKGVKTLMGYVKVKDFKNDEGKTILYLRQMYMPVTGKNNIRKLLNNWFGKSSKYHIDDLVMCDVDESGEDIETANSRMNTKEVVIGDFLQPETHSTHSEEYDEKEDDLPF